MIATVCRYAPAELFAGFDQETERLDPTPNHFDCAEQCAHPNMCSFCKSIIEEVKARNIKEIVLTDCCDSTRRLYDVLSHDPDMSFVYLLPLPHKNGDAEMKMFAQELEKLTAKLSSYYRRDFDMQKARQAFMDQQKNVVERPDVPYVQLSGAHGGKVILERLKEAMKDIPVINDTCTGRRLLEGTIDESESFFLQYAAALYTQQMPCMRMDHNGTRYPSEAGDIKGTIVHTIKFCDYYGFEYLHARKDASHPVMKVESDMTPAGGGQLKTRLDAFYEEIMTQEIKTPQARQVRYAAGIDSGSASTDAVIMDGEYKIIARAIVSTGAGAKNSASKALEIALAEAHLNRNDIDYIVTTGYGRENLSVGNETVTEITCHAKGAHFLNPGTRTVIDIGGQDSKIICIDEQGKVINFVMNDKCAAGTGRFLETQARTLGMSMQEMSICGLQWQNDITISSMCTVFAESEVVGLVAENTSNADIVHALNKAVATKTISLLNRLPVERPYMMTGGVASNAGVVACIEERLGQPLYISKDAQLCGAIGAALIALERG